jgi:Cu(I)/Ag(I) efflux system membrane fusion protein
MKRIILVTVVAVSVAAGSFAGTRWRHLSGSARGTAPAAAVYSCPMHPGYHSEHPGNCPMCGMQLEAVRGGGGASADAAAPPLPHGQLSPEPQQAIGIRFGVVARSSNTRLLRTTGRVVADDNRTYPVVASVSGWIREVQHISAGDAVIKHQVLASFVAPPQFDTAQQEYYNGLEKLYRLAATQPDARALAHATQAVERLADGLRIIGVSDTQLREMAKHRELMDDIRVESPADGIVLKRTASPGLRFDAGFELYRIADLNRVWIEADVYRDQLPFIRRGASARISTSEGSRAVTARVAQSEPIFDETTLTLKVRLEAPNPQLALKPGMFVDVELPIEFGPSLVVPADAIVDSGLRKTVFVECGNGSFEPRQVETGWRLGGDVEVTKGLVPGERIVISGTFFVDSESRMKAADKP